MEINIGALCEEVDDKVRIGFNLCGVSLMEVDGGSRRSRDVENVSMKDKKPTETKEMVSSKEESFGGLKSQDMEIDTPDDTDKNQITTSEEESVLENAEIRSNLLNNALDLNQCTNSNEHISLDVNAKPKKKNYFSNLVWGKVRSHPWWSSQVFNDLAATGKAKKYLKRGYYLISYYGDQTFAWNETSQIKPFKPHFSHMEK